jgi:hypothetical protein
MSLYYFICLGKNVIAHISGQHNFLLSPLPLFVIVFLPCPPFFVGEEECWFKAMPVSIMLFVKDPESELYVNSLMLNGRHSVPSGPLTSLCSKSV